MSSSGKTARLAVLRHGPTAWNEAGRIQGRSDQPLSPAGTDRVGRWQVAADLHGWAWYRSPLSRAAMTAKLLGHPDALVDHRLIEANWGEWEGERLSELRRRHGAEMAQLEDRGLDFRPPGGESPRDLQARLRPFLEELGQRGEQAVAVTHKGVIRALYARASGWNMLGRPPVKLREPCLHIFALDNEGRPRIEDLNCPLLPEEAATR